MAHKFYITDIEDFYSKRSGTIGSSDIPIILGLSKQWKTPDQLWREKTGRSFGTYESTTVTEIGHELEMIILRRTIRDIAGEEIAYKFLLDYIQHLNKRPVDWKPSTPFEPFTFWVHSEIPEFTASPDCIFTWEGKQGIIESKSGRLYANLRREDTEFDGYDEDDQSINGIPAKVLVQVLWQSFVLGNSHPDLHVRALIDTNRDLPYCFQPVEALQNTILKYAMKFLWHIKKDKPPPPMNIEDVAKWMPQLEDKLKIVHGDKSTELTHLFVEKTRYKKAQKEIKKKIDDINQALMIVMGEHRYLDSTDGTRLAIQIVSKGIYSNIGPRKVKENHPEIFKMLDEAGYIKATDRRFIK